MASLRNLLAGKLDEINGIGVCVFWIFLFAIADLQAQKSVLTQHNDVNRSGWYDQETMLNLKSVNPGSFGLLFARAVDPKLRDVDLTLRLAQSLPTLILPLIVDSFYNSQIL